VTLPFSEVEPFYSWLNEVTDAAWEQSGKTGKSTWEIVGLRPDAPKAAKKAFEEYLADEKRTRENSVSV